MHEQPTREELIEVSLRICGSYPSGHFGDGGREVRMEIAREFRMLRGDYERARKASPSDTAHKWDDKREHFSDWIRDTYPVEYQEMTPDHYSACKMLALGAEVIPL